MLGIRRQASVLKITNFTAKGFENTFRATQPKKKANPKPIPFFTRTNEGFKISAFLYRLFNNSTNYSLFL
jgi:hypothetical protein